MTEDIITDYHKRVENYIRMEYGDNLADKMSQKKYNSISTGYIRNCLSLKQSMPHTANGLIRYLKDTK